MTDDADAAHEAELARIADVGKWENCFDKIPVELHTGYSAVIGDFNLNTRIRIYKIIDLFGWHIIYSRLILDVLIRARAEENIQAILRLFEGCGPRHLLNLLNLMNNMQYGKIHEFLYHTPADEALKLLDVAYYVEPKEFELLFEFIEKLSVTEVLRLINLCNEPKSNMCRLCKVLRLASLEYRMLQGHLKPDSTHGFTPGMEPTYDRADVWQNDVDQEFTFLIDSGLIYWRKELVDATRICDKCLTNVIRAAGNVSRYLPHHHIDAPERKEMLVQLRQDEQRRAVLFQNLNAERYRRRVREWAIRALKIRRIALIKEDEEELQRLIDLEKNAQFQRELEGKRKLLADAMKKDAKWLNQYNEIQKIRTANMMDLAVLTNAPGFNDTDNPLVVEREDPHSWRLKMFVPNPRSTGTAAEGSGAGRGLAGGKSAPGGGGFELIGARAGSTTFTDRPTPARSVSRLGSSGGDRDLIRDAAGGRKGAPVAEAKPIPIHVEAAATRFGTAGIEAEIHMRSLTNWKSKAVEFYNSIEERERREAEEARQRAAAEKLQLLEYMANRKATYDFSRKKKQNDIEQAEADRLDRRLEEKLRRKVAKQQRQEQYENSMVVLEDERSKKHEFYVKERALEAGELRRMQMAEVDQFSKGDRFWGIINHDIYMTRLEEMRKAAWENRVDNLREMCLNVKVTRPFADEKGVFRDFLHKLPIDIN